MVKITDKSTLAISSYFTKNLSQVHIHSEEYNRDDLNVQMQS